ncbi:hypothetical protein Plhal304r1_c030g0098331 [Plasmopara halstedii]
MCVPPKIKDTNMIEIWTRAKTKLVWCNISVTVLVIRFNRYTAVLTASAHHRVSIAWYSIMLLAISITVRFVRSASPFC